jgi:pyridoxamine 5'-phosphate oxidase
MQETYLDRRDLLPDPLAQFALWYEEAQQSTVALPHAMALATADAQGRPSARMVLLKECDQRGFVFYTNSNSHKGRDLSQNPRAALVFHWEPLRKQVRVEGAVERVSSEEADAYFATRPRGSQLGAWASPQSESIPDRTALERETDQLEAHYAERDVPRPPHWNGYRVCPDTLEFWVDRASRLHDRFEYRRSSQGWQIRQLAP